MTIEEKYQELLNTPSDVNEHFPTIRAAVEKGDKVVELGMREAVSTWALLANLPQAMVSVDIVTPSKEKLDEVLQATKEAGINFRFVNQDSTMISFEGIDVLFIDTLHLYSHIVKELWRHAETVNKKIIFHDINIPEVNAVVTDFLYNHNWQKVAFNPAGTGLCVLQRISRP